MPRKNFPPVLQIASKRLPALFDRYKYSCGRVRAMRPERRQRLILLLQEILALSCLKYEGAACIVHNKHARPIVVTDLVRRTNIPQRAIERCLADLKEMGFLSVGRQIKQLGLHGHLIVSSVLRMLTKKFWVSIGCWSLFVEAVKYSSKSPIRLMFPRYRGRGEHKNRAPGQAILFNLAEQRTALLCSKFNDQSCTGGYQNASVCKACMKSKQSVQLC